MQVEVKVLNGLWYDTDRHTLGKEIKRVVIQQREMLMMFNTFGRNLQAQCQVLCDSQG